MSEATTTSRQRPRPPGLWAGLATRTGAGRASARRPLYGGLARRLSTRPELGLGGGAPIWDLLAGRVDFAQYRPQRRPDVAEERVSEGGRDQVVLRSPGGRYLRLSEPEAELWRAMDGSQSVAQLATLGFLRFKQLLPVAGLVQSLRAQGFLADAPVGIYSGLRRRQQARSVEGWGRRLLGILRSHEFAIGGVDAACARIYRMGGWLLFTRGFVALLALVCLLGLGAYFWLSAAPEGYALIDPGAVAGSLLGLWAALLLSFALHELSHALAVKHFGRRVLRGGVMIYYGMPAAFVDTSDIWLSGQRARILVSLAGPLCDLLVGSLAAIAALLLPAGPAGAAAFTLATACYLAALLNFNPLLELDGYYILGDWLKLPGLRRRALAFISGPLWQKLRTRAALSGEERVLGVYGLLAAAYTALAVVLAALFWRDQLGAALAELWAGGPLQRALAVAIGLGVLLPLGLGLVFAAWGLVRAAAGWLARRGYARSPLLVAATLGALALALAALPLRYGASGWTALIIPGLWLAALAAQLALHQDYRGAAIARALDSFLVVSAIELVAQSGYLLNGDLAPLWSALEIVGFALLMFAGFVALLDVDLQQSRPAELGASASMLGLAFLGGGLAIGPIAAAHPAQPFLWVVLAASPIYASAVALALLLPQLVGLRDSRLFWSWLLLWLGVAAQTVSYLLELLPAWRNSPPALAALALSGGLWTAAWCSHVITLRQEGLSRPQWPIQPATAEAERLRRGFQHSYAGLYRALREHYGARRARALDDRMDVLAATANWDITLDRDEARVGATLAAAPLDVQGGRYAEVLRYAVAEIQRLAGATFAHSAVRASYDALPWPEREAADRRCFALTPWAGELSRAFGDARAARLALLRQIELFGACDDGELAELAAALEPQRATAGALILAPGAAPPGLWVVEAGEVARKRGDELLEELHRGATFGSGAAAGPGELYRASIDSELLFLSQAELQRLLHGPSARAAESQALSEALRLLERIPLFQQLPRATLRALARRAERRRLPARSIVVRQGRPSGHFFVIASGSAVVVRRAEGEGPARVVASLGPAEFFGELELLRGTPPVASIVTTGPTELLALPHREISELLTGAGELARGLEQIGTGRLIALRGGA